MQNILGRFMQLARRWWQLVVLGVVLCAGITFFLSAATPRVYRATATLIVDFQTTPSSYDSVTASVEAVPTYAQLLTSPPVLKPVVARYPSMTLQQLMRMITVNPKPNSQLIELDVDNADPALAMNIANQICDQFVQYVNPQLAASVFPVYATLPTDPIRPQPLQNAAIAGAVGLGLALALIFLFEWIDDRPDSPEEVQEILGLDALTMIPELSRKERSKNAEEALALAEGCRILCARLNIAQAVKPFKLVMITSPLAGEGKSTTAANLASFLAMTGKRVLLVDADLRHAVLHQHFQLDNFYGLTGAFIAMAEQVEFKLDGEPTQIPTLRVLTAGRVPSNPAELLQSSLTPRLFDQLRGTSEFDYVIFDTPPLLPVADAQILAPYVQQIVLVVDASKTPRKVLLHASRLLKNMRAGVLGVVLNKSPWPDYSAIRQYLIDTWQPGIDIDVQMPSKVPPGKSIDMTVPDTPPVDGQMDPAATIALRRGQKGREQQA